MPSLSEQLKALEDEVTEGPWRALCIKSYTRIYTDDAVVSKGTGRVQVAHIAGPEDDDIRPWNGCRWESDASLLVLLRNNLPRIIQALEAQDRKQALDELIAGTACEYDAPASSPGKESTGRPA